MPTDRVPTFDLDGKPIRDDQPVGNIFAFCVLMATVVADRRGGKNSDYIKECGDFMVEVVGKRLSVADPLPDDFDWTPLAAIEAAEAMMEYDDAD